MDETVRQRMRKTMHTAHLSKASITCMSATVQHCYHSKDQINYSMRNLLCKQVGHEPSGLPRLQEVPLNTQSRVSQQLVL